MRRRSEMKRGNIESQGDRLPIVRSPSIDGFATIHQIEVDARRLITIDHDSDMWEDGFPSGDFRGAIVRLRPPHDATDDRIESMDQAARSLGAVAVKVEARRRAPIHPSSSMKDAPVAKTIAEHVATLLLAVPEEERPVVAALVEVALEEGRRAAPRAIVPESSEPLWITGIRLFNWFRFRDARLELRPTVYGVVARRTDDPERSNWLGKSTFLAAIPFALTGWHPADYDDAWISEGCTDGSVRLELSDGSWILREKRRGQSTRVTFVKDGKTCVGAEANAAIARHIGMTREDFFASAFVQQGQLSRLVTGRASETLKIVAAWLELAPLRAAHAFVLKSLEDRIGLDTISARVEQNANDRIRMYSAELKAEDETFDAADVDVVIQRAREAGKKQAQIAKNAADALLKLRAQAEEVKEKIDKYNEAVMARNAFKLDTEQRAKATKRLEELAVSIPYLLKKHEEEGKKHHEALDSAIEAGAKEAEAKRDHVSKKLIASGQFDGACPVARIECPAKDLINKDRERSRIALEESAERYRKAASERADCDALRSQASGELNSTASALRLQESERDRLQKELAKPRAKEPPVIPELVSIDEIAEQIREQSAIETDAKHGARNFANAADRLAEEKLALERARLDRENFKRDIATRAYAAKLLGPGGLLQNYARAELAAIEEGANAILEEASEELRVSIEWGYESPTALAPACSACGIGFAPSSRAKSCPRCETKRGPKIEEEVRITVNRRSGAAEDMAGLAVQIAASSWLRTSRGSAWRSCAIDEPFGALDRSHARALGSHLASLLAGRHGFRQAFVVAHSTAAMDAMPARLVITGEPGEDGASTIVEEA